MRFLSHAARVLSLVLLSVLGTSVLMYAAPGYFTDAGEMDAAHASIARTELDQLAKMQSSVPSLLKTEVAGWSHGNFGRSRQFGTPVKTLLRERAWPSIRLLVSGVLGGWSLALLLAVLLSMLRGRVFDFGVAGATSLLLALPAGVLATVCLLGNVGGPVLVLSAVIGARDLKVLQRMLQTAWGAPYILHARGSGLPLAQILRVHILPNMRSEVIALAVMSFTLALSALVPVEVIFDVSGLGQLAWSAAMNRDLPVLVAVTGLMATCVGIAGSLAERDSVLETSCA